jgi:glycosyltransferase involved in cell wall biosynthesis
MQESGQHGAGTIGLNVVDTFQPTVSVVVPTLNEEHGIDWVLKHVPQWVSEIVLVDGLSTDFTEAVARTMRPDIVVVHQRQRGKGAALRAGFAAASGDIVAMMDADGSTDPRELGRFVDALKAGADFVKGSRHLEGGGSVDFTLFRQMGNRGFVLLANQLCGSRFTDLCYGYCAFWRRHVDALALTADGFEIETQLVLSAVGAGLKICEVPSFELARRAGTSNLNAFRDGRRVLRTLLSERPRRSPRPKSKSAQIELLEVEVASLESDSWRPAGRDRRRGERRKPEPDASGHLGTERRREERRHHHGHRTATVYVVARRLDECEDTERRKPLMQRLGGSREVRSTA